MNINVLEARLSKLESGTRGLFNRKNETATLADLRRLASDPATLTLYNAALVETGKLVCGHQRHGWCRRCVEQSEPTRAAWRAYQARAKELESKHVVVGQ